MLNTLIVNANDYWVNSEVEEFIKDDEAVITENNDEETTNEIQNPTDEQPVKNQHDAIDEINELLKNKSLEELQREDSSIVVQPGGHVTRHITTMVNPENPSEVIAIKDFLKNIPYSKSAFFDAANVLFPSGITADELEAGLLYNSKDYAASFVEAEEITGVNAIFIASISTMESYWMRSLWAKNNVFGWNDHQEFDSIHECIIHVSTMLKRNYLTETGPFFNGYSVHQVGLYYCPDVVDQANWGDAVERRMVEITNRIIDYKNQKQGLNLEKLIMPPINFNPIPLAIAMRPAQPIHSLLLPSTKQTTITLQKYNVDNVVDKIEIMFKPPQRVFLGKKSIVHTNTNLKVGNKCTVIETLIKNNLKEKDNQMRKNTSIAIKLTTP